MGKALAIIGLLAVLVLTAACSAGTKAVTITGLDEVDTRGGVFTATAGGGAPLYGHVGFTWVVDGKQYGDTAMIAVDALGSAQHKIAWKSSRLGKHSMGVVARFYQPGSWDYWEAHDEHTVTVVK